MAYKIPPSSSPDDDALDVLATMLSGGRSSRFYEAIVRQKQLSANVFAGSGDSRGPGLFTISATAAPGKSLADLEAAIDAGDRAGEDRSDRGLGDRKGAQRRAPRRSWAASAARSSAPSSCRERAVLRRPGPDQHARGRIAKVTAADVQRVAKQYLVKTGPHRRADRAEACRAERRPVMSRAAIALGVRARRPVGRALGGVRRPAPGAATAPPRRWC